jgi:ferrous iron transport protein A
MGRKLARLRFNPLPGRLLIDTIDNNSHLCFREAGAVSFFNLSSVRIGQHVVIQGIAADASVRQRLEAMGLRAGREAYVVRSAHLGGPIQIRVGSISLILRRRDAALVRVAPAV